MIRIGKLALKAAGHAYLAALCVFMLAPIAIVLLVSFSPTPVFDIPTGDFSLQWYRKLSEMYGLWPAVRLSAEIAGIATAISLALGTICAL